MSDEFIHKHTPGPWRIAPASDYISGINIDAGKGGYVCFVGNPEAPHARADAELIASAPIMYDVLLKLHKLPELHKCREIPPYLLLAIDDAIRKAHGC
jgi:hypothetical protein